MRPKLIVITSIAVATAIDAAACRGQPAAPPELQTTTGVQARAEPTVISGCLRAAPLGGAFVLESSERTGADKPTTFQLTGPASLNLGQFNGQRVEVSGVVRSAQQVEGTSEVKESAPQDSKTPVVETKTDLSVKHLEVDSIKRVADHCQL